MNYHAYYPVDVVNGPGTRCTLFVSGCEHKCPGCYNPVTWRAEHGKPFNEVMVEQVLQDLTDSQIPKQGLSLTGGDPLFPGNLESVHNLVEQVKVKAPDKDIWCWTGYQLEQLSAEQSAIVAMLDVVIDGRFEKQQADARLIWKGSSNQRVISISQWKKDHQPQLESSCLL